METPDELLARYERRKKEERERSQDVARNLDAILKFSVRGDSLKHQERMDLEWRRGKKERKEKIYAI